MYIRHEWHVIVLHSLNQFSKFCLILIYLIMCLTSLDNPLTNILREISVNVFVLFFREEIQHLFSLGIPPVASLEDLGVRWCFMNLNSAWLLLR